MSEHKQVSGHDLVAAQLRDGPVIRWQLPTGAELRQATRIAAPAWWREDTHTAVVERLRTWVWRSESERATRRRATAARTACQHRGRGHTCGTCNGSGVDPAAAAAAATNLPEPTAASEASVDLMRCRLCAGIGLLATAPAAQRVAVQQYTATAPETDN